MMDSITRTRKMLHIKEFGSKGPRYETFFSSSLYNPS